MNIRTAIKQLALSGAELYLTICTVDEVDEDTRTISCTPIDEGAQLLAVNLQANQSEEVGLVSFPAVGSEVVVGFINPAVAVVVLMMEVTKTVLTIGETEVTVEDKTISVVNGKIKVDVAEDTLKLDVNGTTLEMDGSVSTWNGGSETTANATNLQQELKKMSARIDAIINAIKGGAVAPMDGGASFKASMIPVISAPPKEDFSNMIDDKIKH